MKNKKGTSKTPKTVKYYYSKASIIRAVVLSLVSLALFFTFFACFMIYGGEDRSTLHYYKAVYPDEKKVLSMIDGVAADGKGRVYVFYEKTFDINVYDESGNFKESYRIPCGESAGEYNGGIVCSDGKLYAFNDVGDVFVFEDGKGKETFSKTKNEDKFNEIYELYKKGKDKAHAGDKTFVNNYLSVTDGKGNVIVSRPIVGFFFSPLSMVLAVVMTVLTVFLVRRYNRKVRNQKIRTIFKKNIIIK
jgi:outer membrane protein assembly factor BamB